MELKSSAREQLGVMSERRLVSEEFESFWPAECQLSLWSKHAYTIVL